MGAARQNPVAKFMDRMKKGMAKVDSTFTASMPEDLQTAINVRKVVKTAPKRAK